jgi:DNA-directed RNA polymerase subunit RPC12/RpoP
LKQTLKAKPTPQAWDAEALWTKALRYAGCMIDNNVENWQKGLWSSLTVEFLARAALANVSPALLSESSQKNSDHLFHALGFEPAGSAIKPLSIGVTDVLRRLASLFPNTFTKELEGFCVRHTGDRNAELHSGETPFDGVDPALWQPEFYRAASALLETMGLSLGDLVGEEETNVAKKLMEAAADEKAKAVLGEVAAHKKVWEAKFEVERTKLKASAEVWASRQEGHRVNCPSCCSTALVKGEPASAPQIKLEDDTIFESQEHLPSQFECVACGLKVLGLSRLRAIKLDSRYKHTLSYDAAEYYSPDDQWAHLAEDNNDPF